jgi:hypothetical protein
MQSYGQEVKRELANPKKVNIGEWLEKPEY